MKHYFFLFALFFGHVSLHAQQVLDTIETKNGPMIIYANRTWIYLKDKEFDGVLNPKIHALVSENPAIGFMQSWDNDVCYSSGRHNDHSRLKDTIWLCVLDEKHNKFHFPVDGIVTSRYGYRNGRHHSGIDLDLETGDTVR